jgi:probable HAF family extracellular repeat protein
VDLPNSQGFNTSLQIYGSPTAISHDGSVIAGYLVGTTTNGVSGQIAVYWVNGVEAIVPAPPDDPGTTTMSATGVSGDGTTLLVQDGTIYSSKVETYVYNISSGTFTSLGFLGSATMQTFATAINKDGTVVAGYSALDNGNINGFIWNASNGVSVLAIPANHPNTFYLEPTCISDDGMTLYGRLTEGGGWVGFRYHTTTGYQDLGDLSPNACTADGTEVVGIENLYFPAVWSVANGGGYLDHLVAANVAGKSTQGLGTLGAPVTISPDGSAITANGPDAYLVDQTWYGAWQVLLPTPLKTAAIPAATQIFSTPYQETLTEPAGTLTQYAEFNTGVFATIVSKPHDASAFVLNADGSFSYTPKHGFYSSGSDPENGYPNDHFTYELTSPNGTSAVVQVQIAVNPPAPPTVDTPTYANVSGTTAVLGGTVESDGGASLIAVGVVYAPVDVDGNPQIGDPGATTASATAGTGLFTIGISNLLPDTTYSYVAYATNSLGISYSSVDYFTTPATFQSWQESWYGIAGNSNAVCNADPYHTGLANLEVFAYLGPNQDPQTASLSQLPQVQMSGGNFYFDFFEPDGVSGVKYGAVMSTDMSGRNWQPVADTGSGTEHIFSVPANLPQVTLRLTVAPQ